MSRHDAETGPEDRARGNAQALPPGIEPGGGHSVLLDLMRRQHRLRGLDRRRPWLLDTAIVLAVFLVCLPELIYGTHVGTGSRTPLPAYAPYVLTVALLTPLWWRRRAPATVFFVIGAIVLVQGLLGVWLPASFSSLIALYTLARFGSLRVLGWAVATAIAEVLLTAAVLVPGERWALGLFFLTGNVTAATAVGLTVRTRRMYLTALEDRARRLEIERDQRTRLAAAAERSRVAREMHDIVGHNLSVMVTLADGAATLATNNGERSAEALRILGDTGRQAMSELRRVLGVLRDSQEDAGPQPLSPQPGIADLDALIARVRAAGVTVTYRSTGGLNSLSGGIQLTVYRTIQEALTNTLKHAGAGSAADVTVTTHTHTDTDTDRLYIRVTDTGPPPGAPAPSAVTSPDEDPGQGLVGIRQRAALYGGTVVIGPRTDRPGWLVDVSYEIPWTSAPHTSGEPAS